MFAVIVYIVGLIVSLLILNKITSGFIRSNVLMSIVWPFFWCRLLWQLRRYKGRASAKSRVMIGITVIMLFIMLVSIGIKAVIGPPPKVVSNPIVTFESK